MLGKLNLFLDFFWKIFRSETMGKAQKVGKQSGTHDGKSETDGNIIVLWMND